MKGKVVLVRFPFDDLSAGKVPPAICLTDPIGPHRHVVLAFVTSVVPDAPLASDLVIDTAITDFRATGLRVASAVRLHRLITVTTTVIRRELGSLSPELRTEADDKLRGLFSLA